MKKKIDSELQNEINTRFIKGPPEEFYEETWEGLEIKSIGAAIGSLIHIAEGKWDKTEPFTEEGQIFSPLTGSPFQYKYERIGNKITLEVCQVKA